MGAEATAWLFLGLALVCGLDAWGYEHRAERLAREARQQAKDDQDILGI